ncbi:glycosyltransferase family 4 protein [Bradyrhizobium lablabi]|nr:glycosyltransferase family 4 protein [Bradyrhizobium lablabi]
MRVAYLVNHYPAVSHSFIRREILALERRGIRIQRISIRGWDDVHQSEEDRLESNRTSYVLKAGFAPLFISFFRVLLTAPLRMLGAARLVWKIGRRAERPLLVHVIYLFEACQVLNWVRAEKCEHLHAHFGTNSAEVAMLVHALGGPTWSFTAHGPEEFDKAKFIALPEKIERAKFVVAISSFGRSQLYRQVSHEHWDKIKIVHCGLEPTFFTGEASPAGTSRRLICVGRLTEQKGQILLIEAARQLRDQGTRFELVLAGDGEMREAIEALIREYDLTDIVRITGWIGSRQVREELLAARALVLPSFAEGLPVVIMEAMALRRPVITTYVAGIPELVQPNEHGWLVPAGDITALTAAMQACLAASKEELEAIGAAAYDRVQLNHNADTEAGKLAQLVQLT